MLNEKTPISNRETWTFVCLSQLQRIRALIIVDTSTLSEAVFKSQSEGTLTAFLNTNTKTKLNSAAQEHQRKPENPPLATNPEYDAAKDDSHGLKKICSSYDFKYASKSLVIGSMRLLRSIEAYFNLLYT